MTKPNITVVPVRGSSVIWQPEQSSTKLRSAKGATGPSSRRYWAFFAFLLLLCAPGYGFASDRETPLVKAVKRAKLAVVNIHSEKKAAQTDPMFPAAKARKVNGMGTGVVIDERGYIVTNFHVVNGVDALRVTLFDGSSFDAQVISYDREHDLAIIKIDADKKLEVMPMGTSSDLMLGESVFAVGNAFGYEHTVTSGIVSHLSRDVEVNEQQSYQNLIQTDASINPGNSGGPLLNLDGEVVGINVAIRANAQRIGFAIPIDDARRVIANLLSIEQLNDHYHGLAATDVKTATLRQLLVESAAPESPAAAAGFQKGDVVLKVGNTNVADSADFERALLGRSVDETVDVVVHRSDAKTTLKLKLANVAGNNIARRNAGSATVVRGNNPERATTEKESDVAWKILGLKLERTTPDGNRLLGARYRGGMKVLDVKHGSVADQNGLRSGDILIGLHIWETVNPDNVAFVLEHPDLPDFSPLKFYILRNGETMFGYLRSGIQVGAK